MANKWANATLVVLWAAGASINLAPARAERNASPPAPTTTPPTANDFTRLPVKEITVFKDGHAFVVHEGLLPTNDAGNVVLDELPAPVMGTFWPYAHDEHAHLNSVTAGLHVVREAQPALSLAELLEANTGTEARFTDVDGEQFEARILALPRRYPDNPPANSTADGQERTAERGTAILLETPGGTRVMPLNRIREVTFKNPPTRATTIDKYRNLLTLNLDWPDGHTAPQADVGLAYLQKGIRWIPSYRVTIDGNGTATLELRATLLNEMTDLEDVTAHLVIGAPSFAFQDTIDPIALNATLARLSPYFQRGSQAAYACSNTIMTQVARMGEYRQDAESLPADLEATMTAGNGTEDLFIFTVPHITLQKGERMNLPVAKFSLAYRDVYTLELPFAPPPEVRQQFDLRQQTELARLLTAPKVMHKIRLRNDSEYPLTTAPALLVQDDRVLAQGMMTYTAIGGSTDLEVTAAINIQVTTADTETNRDLNATHWNGNTYRRTDLVGTIGLTNRLNKSIDVEVVRQVLGNVDSADEGAQVRQANARNEGWQLSWNHYPVWWSWYNFGSWWSHFNGLGEVKWNVHLAPGQHLELHYSWNYYWR